MTDWPDSYACVDLDGLGGSRFDVRPIRWEDREPIREWRNAQLEVLRQPAALSAAEQDAYFATVIRPQLLQDRPGQILVGLTEAGRLVGYGGLVHINWHDRRAEISFMTEATRQGEDDFRADLSAFLDVMIRLARRLGLRRLTTECYAFRTTFMEELERSGFVCEGVLREHARWRDGYVDSVLHGCLVAPE